MRRLDPEGVAELVAAYTASGRVKRLATEFGIHRDTVHSILKRRGVLRLPGIQPNDLPEIIRLYEAGWSLARLANEFDLSPSTVNRALRKAGVPIRRPGPLDARSVIPAAQWRACAVTTPRRAHVGRWISTVHR